MSGEHKPEWVFEYCGMCVSSQIHHRNDSVHEYVCGSCGSGIPYSQIVECSENNNEGDRV